MNEDALLELSNYAGLPSAVVLTINSFLECYWQPHTEQISIGKKNAGKAPANGY
jgi:hypothetical protein